MWAPPYPAYTQHISTPPTPHSFSLSGMILLMIHLLYSSYFLGAVLWVENVMKTKKRYLPLNSRSKVWKREISSWRWGQLLVKRILEHTCKLCLKSHNLQRSNDSFCEKWLFTNVSNIFLCTKFIFFHSVIQRDIPVGHRPKKALGT